MGTAFFLILIGACVFGLVQILQGNARTRARLSPGERAALDAEDDENAIW